MRKLLMSVYDRKAKSYGPLMSYAHEAVAVREFGEALTDEKSMLRKYPDDFEMHQIGTFDDDNGIQPVCAVEPRVVVTASAVVAMIAKGPSLVQEA